MLVTLRRAGRAMTLLAAASLGGLTGVALASTVGPSPGGEQHDAVEAPPVLAPRPETASVETTAADPTGRGPGWGIRVSTSRAGGTCLTVGRAQGSQLGVMSEDGQFMVRAQNPAESCAPPDAWDDEVALVGAAAEADRVIVHGVAGPKVRRVMVGSAEQELSTKRAFIAVFPGDIDDIGKHPVTVELVDGSRVVYPFDGPPVGQPDER